MSSVAPGSSDSLRDAVVFDVDGTLCDVRLIRHFVQAPPGAAKFKANFDRFHAAASNCPPHAEVRKLLITARSVGFAVVVVTGREKKWAELTSAWLSKHHIPFDELRTRGAKDYRPDHVIKAEIEHSLSKSYRVLLAVDDRPDIIEVWRSAGIATVQVDAEGEFLPVDLSAVAAIDLRVAELIGAAVAH